MLLWKNVHLPMQIVHDPLEFGFKLAQDGIALLPVLMSQGVAAPELLNDVICQCVNNCDDECLCHQHKQPCTLACKCTAADQSEDEDNYCQNLYTLLPDCIHEEIEEEDDV